MRYFDSFEELYKSMRGKLVVTEFPKAEEKPEISMDMKKAELVEVAKGKGIEVSSKATKQQIFDAITGAEK